MPRRCELATQPLLKICVTGSGCDSFNDTAHDRLPVSMGWLNAIAAGWNICNSWITIGATLALSIAYQGGPVTLVYGIFVVVFVMGATAASLSELAARYPTAGGQYAI